MLALHPSVVPRARLYFPANIFARMVFISNLICCGSVFISFPDGSQTRELPTVGDVGVSHQSCAHHMPHSLLLFLLAATSASNIVVSSKHVYDVTVMTYGANTPNYINHKFMEAAGDAMINATGVSHVRWPGGNYANQLFWNNDYAMCPYFAKFANKNAESWVWTWYQAAEFARVRGLNVLWQMNAAVGGVCGTTVAADLAVAFVKNATASGFKVDFIEVGNENYGAWETPYPDLPHAVNASIYAATCVAVSKAVKALEPSIRVGCVGDIVDPVHPNTPFPSWQAEVLAVAESAMDFLIIHEYYVKSNAMPVDKSPWGQLNYGCVSADRVGGPNCGPRAVMAAVQRAASEPLDVIISEWNNLQPFSAPTWELVQGLFTAKHLGESMEAGIAGSTYFALANGQKPDYGMFSRDTSSQIAYAPVFTFAIFTRVAPPGSAMLALQMDSKALNVSAFAFERSELGTYGLVLVNMDAAEKSLKLSGPWGTLSKSVTYTLTAASSAAGSTAAELYASKIFAYNGVAGATTGGPFPSAGIDSMPPKNGAFTGSVTLAPVSVTGIIIK